jgi:hypothetical protein
MSGRVCRCERLGLVSLAYLWQRDQKELLQEMTEVPIDAVLVKVRARTSKPNALLAALLSLTRAQRAGGRFGSGSLQAFGQIDHRPAATPFSIGTAFSLPLFLYNPPIACYDDERRSVLLTGFVFVFVFVFVSLSLLCAE